MKICKECLFDIPPGEEPDSYIVSSIEECEYQAHWEPLADEDDDEGI